MKNLLLLLAILPFIASCNEQKKETTENTFHSETANEIQEISISIFGGRSTIISKTYIITKDSIHYSLMAHDTTQNITKSYANTKQDWGKLLKKVDLEDFKNTENGKSHQAYDGTDTEIAITTQNEKITKMNADKNKSWNKVYRQLVKTYFGQH